MLMCLPVWRCKTKHQRLDASVRQRTVELLPVVCCRCRSWCLPKLSLLYATLHLATIAGNAAGSGFDSCSRNAAMSADHVISDLQIVAHRQLACIIPCYISSAQKVKSAGLPGTQGADIKHGGERNARHGRVDNPAKGAHVTIGEGYLGY